MLLCGKNKSYLNGSMNKLVFMQGCIGALSSQSHRIFYTAFPMSQFPKLIPHKVVKVVHRAEEAQHICPFSFINADGTIIE